ncbi:MAG: 16S rRNA (guanine(527)-N(7))-methyltransferase RsmG [Rickettsiales bacterium]|nr:MAG: 16S rRNA (guanine(527)-N(7))-methyltransferase RsmG [Rickettsiales bacterium]
MIDVREYVSRGDVGAFVELLLKWNNTINLISSKTTANVMDRHVLDSLQILEFIGDKDVSIIDFGSGGGFPGILLSIAGVRKVTLIESDARKAAFLRQASKISRHEVEVINDRIENVENLECDIITSRAFADLDSVFGYSRNIQVRDKYLLHKGESYSDEMLKAKKHWLFNTIVHDSITSNRGKILEIRDVEYIS